MAQARLCGVLLFFYVAYVASTEIAMLMDTESTATEGQERAQFEVMTSLSQSYGCHATDPTAHRTT